jgi:signal transduction histidine kinase
MQRPPPTIVLFLTLDIILLVICFLHIPSLVERVNIPFDLEYKKGRVVITGIDDADKAGGLLLGDELLTWEEKNIQSPEVVEFLCDTSRVGQRIAITYDRGGKSGSTFVYVVPYYPAARFLVITFLIGVICWAVGVFVLLHRRGDLIASTLHWMLVMLGVATMMTWGEIQPGSFMSYLDRFLFFVSYVAIVSSFLFFTSLYPKPKPGTLLLKTMLIFGPVSLLAIGMGYFHLRAISSLSISDYLTFQHIFDVFRTLMFVYFGIGIFNVFHSYRNAASREERGRLQWILWGLSIGAIPFLVLFILPQLLFSMYFIREEYATILFLAVPFSFAVSFLKYRLLDIEILINRSIVYAVLSVFLAVTYVAAVLLVATLIGTSVRFEEFLFIGGITVVVGIVLNPLRKRMQHLFDEILFPARTNFRKAITEIGDDLHRALNSRQLFRTLIDSFNRVITFETIAIYSYEPGRLVLKEFHGKPLNALLVLKKEHQTLFSEAKVFATHEAVSVLKPDIDTSREQMLHRLGCSICVPLVSESKELLGVVAARPRETNKRLDEEEIDLLRTGSMLAAEILDRLLVQERMMVEQEERRKAEGLSNLKSEFVSSVSHEFQNPLTVILLHAELLKKRSKNPKVKQYSHIIEGESGRLSRMVSTILDVARIEEGIKQYSFRETNLAVLVRNVLTTMRYQIEKHRFQLTVKLPRGKIVTHVDPDAFSQALINLVSNALKYGWKGKYIRVALERKGEWIACSVEDRGQGISEEALKHLFERYYRDPSMSTSIRGIGLGLSLVKHVVEAHGGRVDVHSTVGKGTVFTLLFPPLKDHKEN